MPDKRSYSYILVYIQIMCYHICKDKGFFFTGIVSVQERRTAYEAKRFLNTRGKHPELVSPELIELLKYMEHSTDEISEACESKRIQEMHRRVCQIKASEKTEVKYIQTWEEKILIKQEGIAEGKQIGVEQINRLNQRLIEQGRFDDLTKAASDKVYQEKLLKEFEI